MELSPKQKQLLQALPGVDRILLMTKEDPDFTETPKTVLVNSIRAVIDQLREMLLKSGEEAGLPDTREVLQLVKRRVASVMAPNLRKTINATGVVVHTNLGRSLLCREALQHIGEIAASYSNLEFDLQAGKRGLRYSHVEELLCEISGAEAAMAVNNNAGAVLLSLDTVARGKSVVVSRGELVEIGGSFRIPDVMKKSGGFLKEIGTTNRTHPRDYENAIDEETGMILKVHTSNYSIVGFTASVPLHELVEIGRRNRLPVMEDLGSGTFIDFSAYGLSKEPTVQESVAAGVDIVTFSGDKLLGGPQAGIIVGKKKYLEQIKKNPLTRALRIDKLTLASLEATLRLYREPDKAIRKIPTLNMLTCPYRTLEKRADDLKEMLESIGSGRLKTLLKDISSKAGGGALPLLDLPSKCLAVQVEGKTANEIEVFMRRSTPPIIGRIEDGLFLMDVRTIADEELPQIQQTVKKLLGT